MLATKATVESDAFSRLVERFGNDMTVVYACPDLAEYIERNIDSYPHIDVSHLLPCVNASSVVLGCTHYVFAKKYIREFYGCEIFDGILGTVDHLGKFLRTVEYYGLNKRKIVFKNGNINKNRKILIKLLGES